MEQASECEPVLVEDQWCAQHCEVGGGGGGGGCGERDNIVW